MKRLEAEADKLKLTPEAMALRMLQLQLPEKTIRIDPDEALLRLREIGRRQPPIDSVQLVRESRQELEQGGIV
ncbi:MAG: hypothetical protein F6J93_30430 [Oscillatoria sp. SIO1A7]|nr:hypothetical protein [Oscillatoria sp. SIO1A7]